MTRRTHITLLAAAMTAISPAAGKENDAMRELLEASQNEKKGLMLYVKGQSIAGIVVKISGDTVEMRSREYSRIAVRIESIDAVAMA
ncbi:MAG TPA: hypothetical protein VKU19_25695 [Bryobacteraceae bacterium]|nr:hypothetical protein [Bryobacteraceae bacterium]